MKELHLIFRNEDGSGKRTIKIPSPVDDIDTKLNNLDNHMMDYLEDVVIQPAVFDEAIIVETDVNELINKM